MSFYNFIPIYLLENWENHFLLQRCFVLLHVITRVVQGVSQKAVLSVLYRPYLPTPTYSSLYVRVLCIPIVFSSYLRALVLLLLVTTNGFKQLLQLQNAGKVGSMNKNTFQIVLLVFCYMGTCTHTNTLTNINYTFQRH